MVEKIAVVTCAPGTAVDKVAQWLLQEGYALIIRWVPGADEAARHVDTVQPAHGGGLLLHTDAQVDVQ